MTEITTGAGWLSVISNSVRERENRRQVLYNNIRKAAHRNYLADFVKEHVPAIVREFLKMILASLAAFWIIGRLLAYLFHANPAYTFPAFGLAYCLQSTYYKYRLSADPNFKIPKCGCRGRANDATETVLQSRHSAIFTVPNSVLGVALYLSFLVLVFLRHTDLAMVAAIAAVAMTVYLSYVMVTKIGSLCVNCINTGALNLLILLQVLRS